MIYSHLQTISLSALLVASGLTRAQTLSKPALRNNLEDIEAALTFALPSASYKAQVWNFGDIAEPCKYEASQNGINPSSIFTYNVTYSDCSIPYVFCFHRDFTTPLSDAAFIFGKVPPRMRQYVRTISFFPKNGNGDAYARGPDVVVRGYFPRVGVYIHESTHATEFSDGFASPALMADQTPWKNGYDQDTAVPSEYARNNQRENLAEHPMFIIYNDNIQEITKIEPNYNRISGQQFILRIEGGNGKHDGNLFQTKNIRCAFRHPFPRKVSTLTPVKRRGLPVSYHETANPTYEHSKKEYEPLGVTCIDPKTLPQDALQKKTQCGFH